MRYEGLLAALGAIFLTVAPLSAARSGADGSQAMDAVSDTQQIEDLMVHYMDLLDAGNYEGYAALFTEDALLRYAAHRLTGRKQIHDVVRAELEALRHPKGADGRVLPPLGMHHLLLNPRIAVEGDRATATSTWIFIKVTADGRTELWGAGRYRDRFTRSGGHWMISERIVEDTVADTIARAKAP